MKKILIIFVLGFLLVSCKEKSQNQENRVNKRLVEDISNLIDSLYVVDQQIQIDIQEAAKNGENEKLKEMFSEEKEIFERHIPFLKDIYNKIGYPNIQLVGKENSHKFFVLVQHSDADVMFQVEMLKEITEEVEKGNVSGKNYAFLTDRVLLAQKKPQIYGTQLDYNTKIGQAFPKNLGDSINVNKKRKAIGLEPIEEYLNQVTKMHYEMNKVRYEKLGIKEPKLYKLK